MQGAESGLVDHAGHGRKMHNSPLRQPASGEAWHYPTAHYRDQHNDGGEAETPSQSCCHSDTCPLQMHQQIGGAKDA
jgi:hypothetical protein